MTDTKMIFSLIEHADTVLGACSINKVSIPVVAVKVDQQQPTPAGVIELGQLIQPIANGKTNNIFIKTNVNVSNLCRF